MKSTPYTKAKRKGVWGGGKTAKGTTYHGAARDRAADWKTAHAAPDGTSDSLSAGSGDPSISSSPALSRLTHAPVIEIPKAPVWCHVYAERVIAGEILVGPTVRAACRRHLADLERAKAGESLWFDIGAYTHFAMFCEQWLRFYAGQYADQPFYLHLAQEFIVGNIFGWRMWRPGYPEDDPTVWPRRFRRCYLEMGKGNGKTPLMAAIALYGLLADKEPGAEIYIGASKTKQAHVCFDDAVKMARASPIYELLRVSGITPAYRVDHLPSESWIDILSSQSGKTESGTKPHIVLLDEVHEHPDGTLIDMMQRGFKWRRQPLLVMATNSGWDVTSVAWEEHEHARRVAIGELKDDASFGYICDLDVGDDPLTDPSCWLKANPLLGTAATMESLEQAVTDAGSYPTRQNNIRRLHFCQWTEGATSWITAADWMIIEHKQPGGLQLLAGKSGIVTIDLSHKYDSTAICYIVENGVNKAGQTQYLAHVRSYLPAGGIRDMEERDRRPYTSWARLHPDMLRLTEGVTIEHEEVAADILDDMRILNIEAIVYDAYLFDAFTRSLVLVGWDDKIPQIEHPQGWTKRRGQPLSMSISIGALERYMRSKRLLIHENPIMRAAVAGAKQLPSPTGQTRWDKVKSTSRIDPLVALTMGVGVCDIGLDNLVQSETARGKGERLAQFWRGYASSGGLDGLVGLRA